jgi:hypothetical protein
MRYISIASMSVLTTTDGVNGIGHLLLAVPIVMGSGLPNRESQGKFHRDSQGVRIDLF